MVRLEMMAPSTGLFKQTHLDDGGPSALGQTTHSRERSAENERAVQQKLSGVSCVTTTCLQAPRAPGRATPTELDVVFGP